MIERSGPSAVCLPRRWESFSMRGARACLTVRSTPGSLEGDALSRWYLRSPSDIERERQATAAGRYQDFFYGTSGSDPDPGFGIGAPTIDRDVDPEFAAPLQPPAPLIRLSGAGVAQQQPRSLQGTWYGSLYAPPPDDVAELRRQQAEFARTTREIDKQNSWLAIPALAPAAAVFGLEGTAAIAGRALGDEAIQGPLNFVDREAWQRGAQRAAQALSDAEKNALRSAARSKLARANGVSTREMQAEVHHSEPLEWAHLKPNADPNRLANPWGLRGEAHDIATRAWADFSRALKGRVPTQAELMEAKLRIDRMVEPFIRRAGVPRSNTPPREGGPI
jgi:hypothetical protein